MSFIYRVTVFGVPQGPWRDDLKQAQRDAIHLDLGEIDEWGRFWLTVPGHIQSVRKDQVRRAA